jgi:hypothetical protein
VVVRLLEKRRNGPIAIPADRGAPQNRWRKAQQPSCSTSRLKVARIVCSRGLRPLLLLIKPGTTPHQKKSLDDKKMGGKNRQPVQALSESASPASLCIFLSFYFFVALFLRVRPDQE